MFNISTTADSEIVISNYSQPISIVAGDFSTATTVGAAIKLLIDDNSAASLADYYYSFTNGSETLTFNFSPHASLGATSTVLGNSQTISVSSTISSYGSVSNANNAKFWFSPGTQSNPQYEFNVVPARASGGGTSTSKTSKPAVASKGSTKGTNTFIRKSTEKSLRKI